MLLCLRNHSCGRKPHSPSLLLPMACCVLRRHANFNDTIRSAEAWICTCFFAVSHSRALIAEMLATMAFFSATVTTRSRPTPYVTFAYSCSRHRWLFSPTLVVVLPRPRSRLCPHLCSRSFICSLRHYCSPFVPRILPLRHGQVLLCTSTPPPTEA